MQKTKTNSTVSVCYIWRTIKSITLKLMHRHFCVTKTRIFHKLVNMNSHELLLIFFYLLQKCRVGDLEKKKPITGRKYSYYSGTSGSRHCPVSVSDNNKIACIVTSGFV